MPQGYTAEFRLWSMSVTHPRLPSPPQIPPDQNPVEIELPKIEIELARLELSIKKWIRLIRFRVSATRFPPDSGRAGFEVERGDEGEWRTWITAGIPLFIQISVASSRLRSKISVNGCICQFLYRLWQYEGILRFVFIFIYFEYEFHSYIDLVASLFLTILLSYLFWFYFNKIIRILKNFKWLVFSKIYIWTDS